MTSTPPSPPSIREALSGAAEPSCRCVVARGRSPRVEMTFKGDTPVTYRVGAAREADWWLTGRGVPEQALELHWDGELLWVADRVGHGRATVDGEPLGARWRGLGGQCRLEFPGGALVVECSRPGVVTELAPASAPSVAPPVRSDVREVLRPPPMPEAPTQVRTLEAMVDEPTRTWQAQTPPKSTLPGPAPDRPRTVLPPPNPGAALDDLEMPTREVIKSGHAPRHAAPGTEDGHGVRRKRASTGG